MRPQKPSPSRSDRLEFLLTEQARIRRSRVRRRNTAVAAAMILLVGAVAWWAVPRQQVVPPQHQRQAAKPPVIPQPDPLQPGLPRPDPARSDPTPPTAADSEPFRIARIEDTPLKIVAVVSHDEPHRVEYINDLQLFVAMRAQGIDAGLMRINGTTQLAFNDEESRHRFERGLGSPE
ncbi:MAG: hypothetical protein ACIAQF_09045 [Phycisphaerales bacterium JB065]